MLSQTINIGKIRLQTALIAVAPKVPAPSVRTLFMEITVRYSAEIQLHPNLIPPILEFFVGRLGIHSVEPRVQFRAWYLFDRLLSKLQKNIAAISEQILSTFTDLLVIRPPETSEGAIETLDSDSEGESERDVFFDYQLYLFQSTGLLTALSEKSNFQLPQNIIRSLESSIGGRLEIGVLEHLDVLYVHHSIMAIGNVAKGFDGAAEIPYLTRQQHGARLFYPAAEMVLKALSRCEDFAQIRDAVHFVMDEVDHSDTLYFFAICRSDGRDDS